MNNLTSNKFILSSESNTVNKYALKLLGIDHTLHCDEEILEFLTKYVQASSIASLLFDNFNDFYIVFLLDIEAACRLIGKRLDFNNQKVDILPLLDYYIVRNVHFSLSNEDVCEIFRQFGNVYEVNDHKACPNSSKFSHVLSGQRELCFLLPGKEVEIPVPGNVTCLPYHFHVKKFCSACLSEGHSILSCPDIEDNHTLPKAPIGNVDSDNDFDNLSFNAEDFTSDVEDLKIERNDEEYTQVKYSCQF